MAVRPGGGAVGDDAGTAIDRVAHRARQLHAPVRAVAGLGHVLLGVHRAAGLRVHEHEVGHGADARDAALVGLAGAAGQGEALVVRGSLLVDTFVRLFELQWELALPIADVARGGDDGADGRGGDVLTEVERRLVAMLSSGMTDEAMARAIGLSHRTVQRRLADLARRVGAEGRFQLGVQAARRGWV